jgi:hypothetical protein
VIGVPPNITEAFDAGSLEFVGPCQYRNAPMTGAVIPLTEIEPVPSPPRMPPTPNSPTSTFDAVMVVGETETLPVVPLDGVHVFPEQVVCVLTVEPD